MNLLNLFTFSNCFRIDINTRDLERRVILILQYFGEQKGEIAVSCANVKYFGITIEVRKEIGYYNRMSEYVSHFLSFGDIVRSIEVWICCFCEQTTVH